MNNHLKNETSPYLLQHSDNPVGWYPWGEEAFARARAEGKPIFLSIGYSTCHWCHVMAHESFENMEIAQILNKHFVSVKVDREERPDIDSVYMSVCQAFTGSGGWPTSIFMTADKKPFFAGTYFPPTSRYGMPGFADLLTAIADRWENNRQELLRSAEEIVRHLKNSGTSGNYKVRGDLTEKAIRIFSDSFDERYGGFGSAPKFPTPHNLLFLLLYAQQNRDKSALNMVEKTLLQMRKGGIFDHIGGGFSRYSTDKFFLAPHFEKMLYDNALLIMAYSAAYSVTGNNLYLDTAEKTAEYILREMTAPDGGFYSAQDADSDGVEGKYYTFTLNEIIDVLGDEMGRRFVDTFDITENGNFEGVNIPNLLKSNNLESGFNEELAKLYDYRKNRTKLHLDDKIMLSWNSMMIVAMSILYRVSRKEIYLNAAVNAQQFIEKNLCRGTQLFTSYRDGKRSDKAFLDDYAFYTAALIELYNSTLESGYLEKAETFCTEAIRIFSDSQNGGFYLSPTEDNELPISPKERYDGAIPSGNSVMAYNFVRLYQLTEKDEYRELAEKQIDFLNGQAQSYPAGHCMFLLAKLIYENPPKHIVIVPKDSSDLQQIREKLPFFANVVLSGDSSKYPLINDRTTYYVCKDHSCLPPTNEI